MSIFKTPLRMDWPTVLLVALDRELALKVTESLGDSGITVIFSASASPGRERIPTLMPHVVVVADSLDKRDRASLEELARAVGAELLAVPADAHPAIIRERVIEATDRTSERRLKIKE